MTIEDLAVRFNFSTQEELKNSIDEHIKVYIEDKVSKLPPSLSLLYINKAYRDGISCYNASIYEYIFVTLINIQKYIDLLAKSKGTKNKISSCEITILTTQIPSSFEDGINRNLNPYYKHDIMIYYMKLFNELTKSNRKIKINRYYICDDIELDTTKDNNRIKFFYKENDLRTCLCSHKDSSGGCLSCKSKINGCTKRRETFFSSNPNTKYYYLPLSSCTENRNENLEIRELIGFKIDNTWDLVITSNLIDYMSNLFLKFHIGKDLYEKKDFNFLGVTGMSFVEYMEMIEAIECQEMHDFWEFHSIL